VIIADMVHDTCKASPCAGIGYGVHAGYYTFYCTISRFDLPNSLLDGLCTIHVGVCDAWPLVVT
jgi:hypothetical protein